jgi:AhpD family alkylhydroperoxidase
VGTSSVLLQAAQMTTVGVMRFNPYKVDSVSYQHLTELSKHHTASPLDNALLQLIDVRVSQINGCAFCLAMHTEGARKAGVSQQQLDVVAGWRDAEGFSDRERAALDLAEAMTRVNDGGGVSDDTWEAARRQFDDEELATLLWAIGLINVWNRVNAAIEMTSDLRAISGSSHRPGDWNSG